jgi:hypothetical protein
MKRINNERGATLIISLLLILLIVILTSSLGALAVTSLKQAQMTEDNLEMTNLAEMGVVYYNKEISDFVLSSENIDKTPNDLKSSFPMEKTVVIDENHSFKVEATVDETRSTMKVLFIQIKSTGIKDTTGATKEIISNLSFTNKKRNFEELTPTEEEKFTTEVSTITEDPVFNNNSSFRNANTGNEINCNSNTYSGSNFMFNNIEVPDCNSPTTINGNAEFNKVTLDEESALLVKENAKFHNDFIMEDESIFTVLKDAYFTDNNVKDVKLEGTVTIKGNVKMQKGRNDSLKVQIKGDEEEKTTVTIGDANNPNNGDGNFFGSVTEIKVEDNVEWTIYGNSLFDISDKFELKDSSVLNIKGDAVFHQVSDDFTMKDSTITIDGNALFRNITDKFKLENSTIIINGHASFKNIVDRLEVDEDSTIHILGNADFRNVYFNEDNLEKVKGRIIVDGYALLHDNQTAPLLNPKYEEDEMDKLQYLLKETRATDLAHIALNRIFDRTEREPTEVEWTYFEPESTIEY